MLFATCRIAGNAPSGSEGERLARRYSRLSHFEEWERRLRAADFARNGYWRTARASAVGYERAELSVVKRNLYSEPGGSPPDLGSQ
jgi:hypothetical protein